MDRRRALDGDWLGVFGPTVTLLLPPHARTQAVAAWPLVDDAVEAVAVLESLVAGGLGDLPDFVLVEVDEDRVRIFVRGGAEVVAHSREGRVRVRAVDRLWEEDAFSGLVALEVVLPGGSGPVEESGYAVRPGLARVGAVTWGEVPDTGLRTPSGPVLTAVPALEPDVGPDDEPAGPEPAVHAVPPVDPTVPPPRSTPPPSTPPHVEEPPETAPISSSPPAPPWQEEVTSHLPPVDQGGLASLGFGAHGPDDPVAVLVFGHGETVPVRGPVLVGRAPARRASSPGARLVTVPSPHQEVSATHLEIRPGEGLDTGMAVVTDLGSTNGTVVVQPGLPPRELRAGQPVQLLPGAVVDLGDGATVEVRRP